MRLASLVAILVAISLLTIGCGANLEPKDKSIDPVRVWPRWDEFNGAEKLAYMKTVFMPEMRALFLAFDPHRYPNLDCTPCHAKSADPMDFRMPNADLRLPIWGCHGEAPGDPLPIEMVDDALDNFMREDVTPRTARLLGRPMLGPEMPRGVTCFVCHGVDR